MLSGDSSEVCATLHANPHILSNLPVHLHSAVGLCARMWTAHNHILANLPTKTTKGEFMR